MLLLHLIKTIITFTYDNKATFFQGSMSTVATLKTQCWVVPSLTDLDGHGAGHHISGCQIFSVGGISLHKTLALAVDEDSTLTTAALCDQATGSIDTLGATLYYKSHEVRLQIN